MWRRIFLKSIKNILDNSDYSVEKIDAIEYIEEEANKSKKILKDIDCASVINDDFYNFYINCKKKYNLIIGNPPYIRYQYLTAFQREKQSQVLIKNKMKSNKLINSWVFFLVACIELLEKNGTIAFVIPAEIMQVAYAEDLREYLSKHLSKINIISFNELLFEDAEQEVVVLIGKKKDKEKECLIANCLYDNVDDFIRKYNQNDLIYEKILTNDKWTRYYLNEKENNVIEEIKQDSRFRKMGDVSLVNVGITTGNNDYFSLDDNSVKKYDFKKYTKPLIGRSSQTHGLVFDEDDWKKNVNKGVKAYLLTINENVNVEDMSEVQREYIKIGEDNGANKGYKCRIRKKWYSVPSIWIPDAFLLRRSNVYPKFVLNGIDAVSTDTMHRIKIKDEYDNKKILLSYYNSISFAFTELCGRSYGGGVLEILPKEAENIIIPNIDDMDEQNVNRLIGILDDNIRNKKDIREAIRIMDKEILENYLGISADTINMYREIWKTLNDRRMNRK